MKSYGKYAVIPGLAPIDATTSTKYSDVIDMKNLEEVTFIIPIGNVNAAVAVVTIEENTTAATGGTAIAFDGYLTAAVGSDNPGAITAVTVAATGWTIAADDDGKVLVISIKASQLDNGYPFVNVCIDPDGGETNLLVAIVAIGSGLRYEGMEWPTNVV
jgi:hypothetical protein